MVDLLQERQASNLIIVEAMVEARRLSAEALEMTFKANEIRDKAGDQIITERHRAFARLHLEHAHHSRESERLRQKQAMSNEMYHQVQEDVAMLSNKLKEQHVIWQTRLCEIDSPTKDWLSKEQIRRQNIVQQQLDRSSAVECQLMEIIEVLEVMNNEFNCCWCIAHNITLLGGISPRASDTLLWALHVSFCCCRTRVQVFCYQFWIEIGASFEEPSSHSFHEG